MLELHLRLHDPIGSSLDAEAKRLGIKPVQLIRILLTQYFEQKGMKNENR